jgi:hypothetical protein
MQHGWLVIHPLQLGTVLIHDLLLLVSNYNAILIVETCLIDITVTEDEWPPMIQLLARPTWAALGKAIGHMIEATEPR